MKKEIAKQLKDKLLFLEDAITEEIRKQLNGENEKNKIDFHRHVQKLAECLDTCLKNIGDSQKKEKLLNELIQMITHRYIHQFCRKPFMHLEEKVLRILLIDEIITPKQKRYYEAARHLSSALEALGKIYNRKPVASSKNIRIEKQDVIEDFVTDLTKNNYCKETPEPLCYIHDTILNIIKYLRREKSLHLIYFLKGISTDRECNTKIPRDIEELLLKMIGKCPPKRGRQEDDSLTGLSETWLFFSDMS